MRLAKNSTSLMDKKKYTQRAREPENAVIYDKNIRRHTGFDSSLEKNLRTSWIFIKLRIRCYETKKTRTFTHAASVVEWDWQGNIPRCVSACSINDLFSLPAQSFAFGIRLVKDTSPSYDTLNGAERPELCKW